MKVYAYCSKKKRDVCVKNLCPRVCAVMNISSLIFLVRIRVHFFFHDMIYVVIRCDFAVQYVC